MAKLRYFIDINQPNKKGLVPINAILTIGGKRCKKSMGIKVHPDDWIKEKETEEEKSFCQKPYFLRLFSERILFYCCFFIQSQCKSVFISNKFIIFEPMKYNELIRLLNNNGWQKIRQRGSHIVMEHYTIQEQLIVPYHEGKEVKKGMLHSILKKADIKTTKR